MKSFNPTNKKRTTSIKRLFDDHELWKIDVKIQKINQLPSCLLVVVFLFPGLLSFGEIDNPGVVELP